ncbi:MAG TPA: c-type cytochrome [Steroidobacteraceae bacterium]|nr:c-type cytochrome [Steroidobacteraceae bacterium]
MKSLVAARGLVALLGLGLVATTLAAEPLAGDAAAGAAKAVVCGACHGATGNSVNPEWPNLAGQHHEYVTEQLGLFKSGVRVAPVMGPMAVALSPQDMADLASYFERQTLTGLEADPGLWQAGQKLYRGGDQTRGIPACSGCHGPNGRGNGPARWPQIRSQQPAYVANQLKGYASRSRYTAVTGQPAAPASADMMYDIAKRLSADDITALTAYLKGLR